MHLRFPTGWSEHRHPVNVRHYGDQRTLGERTADTVAAGVGSWPFIIVQSSLLIMWILANAVLIKDWIGGPRSTPTRSSC